MAAAHPEYAPSTVNHYLKLDLVAPDRLRLAYTVLVGPAPAAAARAAADANHDGTLDDAETRALGERFRAAVRSGLELTVDGARLTPAFEPPEVGLAGAAVGANPFSVDLVATLVLGGAGPHEVRLDDRTPEPQLGETEIRIEESPVTTLLTAHRGAEGSGREPHFLFRGPRFSALEDRSIGFRFGAASHATAPKAVATTAPSPWRARLVSLLIFGGLVALLLGLSVRRARRR